MLAAILKNRCHPPPPGKSFPALHAERESGILSPMKISDVGYKPTPAQLRRTANAGAAGSSGFSSIFSAAESAGSAATHAASAAGPASNVAPLLAMQEVDERESRRRRAVQMGQDRLQTLDRLRQALLMGAVPPHLLHALSEKLAAEKLTVEDPRLRDVLDEIELRVAVELAKLEVATGNYA